MKVFKFGGASVKNADAIRNLTDILLQLEETKIVIVISAMAKTTNALEDLVKAYFNKEEWKHQFDVLKKFHLNVVDDLFGEDKKDAQAVLIKHLMYLESKLYLDSSLNYNFEYDQIVSYGEILSTTLISTYLNYRNVKNTWIDARKLVRTNSTFREASINWKLSTHLLQQEIDFRRSPVYITQGFIGSDKNNSTTTLGREGSDFTAAAIAFMLDAEAVTIWKDVPGVLNADPKFFKGTIKLDHISYVDAIELAYFGTSIIHPKTIQPLQQKKIPLFVKSFVDPSLEGTLISSRQTEDKIPCFIVKKDQRFLHIATRDFSFIVETHLEEIFRVFACYGLRMNIMQNSAISFDVCVNNDETRVPQVIADLEENFNIKDEEGLELITIRHYDDRTISQMIKGKQTILQQKTKENIQLIVKQED